MFNNFHALNVCLTLDWSPIMTFSVTKLSSSFSFLSSPGKMSRPPPHLRGRAIGMYYAARSKGKREQFEQMDRSVVLMNERSRSSIQSALEEIKDLRSRNPPLVFSNDPGTSLSDVCFATTPNQTFANQVFKSELESKASSSKYQEMLKFRENLPAYKMREEIWNDVNSKQVCVISGETGCGKTTQVPQIILDAYVRNDRGSECRIVCTQPRRISAISISQRVAEERDEKLGNSVGYSIRVEHKLPRDTGKMLYRIASR